VNNGTDTDGPMNPDPWSSWSLIKETRSTQLNSTQLYCNILAAEQLNS